MMDDTMIEGSIKRGEILSTASCCLFLFLKWTGCVALCSNMPTT
jgi:hypothetical protein